MKTLAAILLLQAFSFYARCFALNLNIPPLDLGHLSGQALAPLYNGPRQVTIVNPKLLGTSRRRQASNQKTAQQPSTGVPSALYSMLNYPGYGNYVVAYAVFPNGSVDTSMTPTYGGGENQKGARFSSNSNTFEAALDSQSPMVQAGARVFVVNAGSNTFTTFAVNCTNPTQLIELGTVAVNGEYPSTLAVAIENQIVCVATTGTDSGIECYTFDAGFQTINPPQYFAGTKLSLPLPIQQASGVPAGPADTVSQLIFTDDEKYLIAVVKSAMDSNGNVVSPGYINVYPLTSKGLGQPVQSTPANTQLLFGCTLQYNTYNLFCTDAGFGTFSFVIDKSTLQITTTNNTPTSSINPGGQAQNCWSTRSPYANGPLYVSAINENYIAAFQQSGRDSGRNLRTFNFTNGNPQLIEPKAANNFVYALSFGKDNKGNGANIGPHLLVAQDTNLAGSFTEIQNVALPGFSLSYEGLSLFIPTDEANLCDFV